ncbi:tRNA (uridine(34)/cytosine(34)/5-carboxymethylaminomethyluridine(34)-2'-O)-methyltransferase TrmL [Acidihalobacter aeolianus]|uniref:tRNA (cytidine(34)-2'-O)-methyltransferase n=1 Tax=Acidihalobacter aeolianus TaxID=2792603 RepID=A0A1D8K4I3_9GAMM|nr:tRNA (uridine(34)/cytosine(34)/5-carboxymethylaminomethyluridine(34)-2'-O)-methyltransferase TrmL [Acidihalobacter aeolianus]AOV15862.1 tRNA (uridine(34)/cytosine(34)/5-carboxymethylaminomethyluridine(34)-2'-O)-methyltransferase TrmL [Acidihalobacter aeolianus]
MFHVVLYQPEIPPNTGNVIRLCANTGCHLHLIRPLGFVLDDRRLRRAGLDYHEWAEVREYDSLEEFAEAARPARSFAMSTRGTGHLADTLFKPGDAFVFGPETRGLPQHVLDNYSPERRLRLPMLPHSRSLNLSNSVAVTVFEAWRQNGFAGGL